jgi:multidrug efflux system outer membrane protein
MSIPHLSSRRLFASVAALALLAGCAGYGKPTVETPPAFEMPQAADAAVLPDALWWQKFQSEELSRLILEAKANSHDLKAAVARILQAEASAKVAGSSLYPALSAGGSASRSQRQNDGGPDTVSTSYQGAAQASYVVDLFGEIRNAARSADQRLESSLYDRETVEMTLVSDVIITYLQAVSARQRLALAGNRLRNAEEILRLLETQRRVGVLSDLELSQQRSALANQRASIPALRLALQQSLDALAVLLGRTPQGFAIAAQSLADVALPRIAAGIPSTLLIRRPDLRRAESDLKGANFDVKAARAARFPSIQLTASGGSSSGALASLFSTGTFFYSVGGSVAQTLFAGGRLQGQEQGARARYKETLENYYQAVNSAFRDVEDALAAVEYNGQQYGFIREAQEQADIAYRLAELRYRSGLVDFQTVLNAQNAAFQAQESIVQSELSRFTAVVGLVQALGGGWDGEVPEAPPLRTVYDPA